MILDQNQAVPVTLEGFFFVGDLAVPTATEKPQDSSSFSLPR